MKFDTFFSEMSRNSRIIFLYRRTGDSCAERGHLDLLPPFSIQHALDSVVSLRSVACQFSRSRSKSGKYSTQLVFTNRFWIGIVDFTISSEYARSSKQSGSQTEFRLTSLMVSSWRDSWWFEEAWRSCLANRIQADRFGGFNFAKL